MPLPPSLSHVGGASAAPEASLSVSSSAAAAPAAGSLFGSTPAAAPAASLFGGAAAPAPAAAATAAAGGGDSLSGGGFGSLGGGAAFSPGACFFVSSLLSTAEAHPLLPLELLRRIESSDPSLTILEIKGDAWSIDAPSFLGEKGGRALARSLSLNTCITSLNLDGNQLGSGGLAALLPALTHLTALTSLDLMGNNLLSEGMLLVPSMMHLTCITSLNFSDNQLGSGGLAALLPALTHLTALTSLDLRYNTLTAEDGARVCGAAAAAGMTRLQRLELYGNGLSASSVVGCSAWGQLGLPQPPADFVAVATLSGVLQYTFSRERGEFADRYHPLLPAELVGRIESSDPSLTILKIRGNAWSRDASSFLGEKGGRALARSLSLNTCITRLNLAGNRLGSGGLAALLPALTHLTALTSLDLRYNTLTAEDGARVCGAAAAAGMTRLQRLELEERIGFCASSVGCSAWGQLGLPQPPDEIINRGYGALIQYLLSEDKIASNAIRMFVVGESTVRNLIQLSLLASVIPHSFLICFL